MRNPDEVRLIIEGQELTGFNDGVTIDMAADHIADGFSVNCPWDPADVTLRRLFRPFGYQTVQIYLGDEITLDGRVDKVTPSLDGSDRVIVLEGRSKTGALCDCSIDGDLQFDGLTLAGISRKLSGRLGVDVRADADTAPIPETRAEYGQAVGEYLNSLAAPRNILLNSSYDGMLVLTSGAALSARPPVAPLEEGRNLVSASSAFDSSARFSLYKVATQFAGIEDIVGQATDARVPVTRPNISAAGETDTDPNQTAGRLRTEAVAKAFSVSARVSGWRRDDGKRWSDRQVVTLKAPSAMIYEPTPLIIAGCKLTLSGSDGRVADLRLVPTWLYSGTLGKEPAWV